MSTYQDFVYNSTPANADLLRELGAIRGLVASKIIYAANLRDGVCRFGFRRMSNELGLSLGAISQNVSGLENDGYILMVQPAHGTDPAHYKPTNKLLSLIGSVQQVNASVQQVNKEEDKQDSLYKSKPPKNPKPQKPKTKWENAGPVASSVIKVTKLKPSAIVNGTELDLKNVLRFLQAENIESDHVLKFAKWYGQTPTLKAITDNWGRFEAGELPPHKQYAKNKQYPKDNANGNQKPTAIKLTPEEKQRADELNRQLEAVATKGI